MTPTRQPGASPPRPPGGEIVIPGQLLLPFDMLPVRFLADWERMTTMQLPTMHLCGNCIDVQTSLVAELHMWYPLRCPASLD